jgi:hypothetical protein
LRRLLPAPTLVLLQAPTLRCFVCSSSAVAVLTLTIVYRRPRTLPAPPIRRWWTTAVIFPMCRPTRNELPWVVCCAVSAVWLPAVMAALAFLFVPSGGWSFFWSFFWSFLVGGLSFGGVYWLVFLLVVSGGWSVVSITGRFLICSPFASVSSCLVPLWASFPPYAVTVCV